MTPNTMIFLSGKVVTDDGSALTEKVSIHTLCRGKRRLEARTDSNGNFSFQVGNRFASSSEVQMDAETSSSGLIPDRSSQRDLRDCELEAALPGFRSDVIRLEGRFFGYDNANIGQVVLHRLKSVEGLTISATTAAAPDSARKALEKGQEDARKGKWDDAKASLEKAVAIYPKFAVAWFELGRATLQKADLNGARHCFLQAIAADSRYVNPYHALTQIALQEQNWKELAEFSNKLLALNPVSFPDVWLSSSIAHFYLQDFAAAETSARRGLEADPEHRVPKLEYLLGMALLKKPDYQEAADHLRTFMRASTAPAEIAEAQKQLDEVARLSVASSSPSENK